MTAELMQLNTTTERMARVEGWVAVWPDSPDGSWNSGTCCGQALADDRDDVAFVVELIDHLAERLSIDPERVYVTGFSNGCSLAQRLAAEASFRITAVSCAADFLEVEPPPDYEPVPMLLMHGTSDDVVPFPPSQYGIGAVENARLWASRNGCSTDVESTEIVGLATHEFGECDNNAEVVLIEIADAGHGSGFPPEVWQIQAEFFQRSR